MSLFDVNNLTVVVLGARCDHPFGSAVGSQWSVVGRGSRTPTRMTRETR